MRNYHTKTHKPTKQYMAIIDGNTPIHFRQAGASDSTIHKDDERKQQYRHRHMTTGMIQQQRDFGRQNYYGIRKH